MGLPPTKIDEDAGGSAARFRPFFRAFSTESHSGLPNAMNNRAATVTERWSRGHRTVTVAARIGVCSAPLGSRGLDSSSPLGVPDVR
ncbi:MAG: hypothetical protein JWP63_1999, partial [Candidatus Solibacter sp.]|nr:hypothetical protein [Candidatus Solibacter sp.]